MWVVTELTADWHRKRIAAFQNAIEAEVAQQGITARVRACDEAMRGPAFDDAFKAQLAASAKPENEHDIREIAYAALRGLGVDLADVQFTVFWGGPDGNAAEGLAAGELRFGGREQRCTMTPEATQRCIDAINARSAGEATGGS
jgi:hypothetical protein